MGIKRGEWRGHLKAVERSGMSLRAFAAEHGINVRRLYEARCVGSRAKAARARQASAFVPVKVKQQSSVIVTAAGHHGEATAARFAMQARLDNGVVLSWTYDASSASAQANMLHTLAGLPCFA